MLIMNQKNDAVLNMDHIKKIFNAGGEVLAESRNGDLDSLGDYATTERAAAVLMEIVEKYGQYIRVQGGPCITTEGYVQPLMFEPPKVYTMPKE